MDLVDLRYLSIAVETGSFSRAAEALGIKPSTIRRRIVRLEDELGGTISEIFERGSFGIRLTATEGKLNEAARHLPHDGAPRRPAGSLCRPRSAI